MLDSQAAAVGFEPGFGCGAGFGIGLVSGTGAGLLGGAGLGMGFGWGVGVGCGLGFIRTLNSRTAPVSPSLAPPCGILEPAVNQLPSGRHLVARLEEHWVPKLPGPSTDSRRVEIAQWGTA